MIRSLCAGVIALCCFTFLTASAFAADGTLRITVWTQNVWPGVAPGEPATPTTQPSPLTKGEYTQVNDPTIAVYPAPADKANGVAVLVCPGGGYRMLAYDKEGTEVAEWLNTLGVTGIVLKYRVPARADLPRWLPALQDAQRAMSLIRSKADEWKIKPDHLGMLGFSAGGHLTAATSTNFDKRSYTPIDAVDQLSSRPDFAVVIYPGGVIQKGTDQLSSEIRVSKETPPTFIAQANDDPVNSDNSVYYYLALKHAGVSAELHIYAAGGHGFGLRPSKNPCSTWPARCEEWMLNRGILPASK
jgi:acetyl esterase/lipase